MRSGRKRVSLLVKVLVALHQPILGALTNSQKQKIEAAIGDRRFFSVAGATGCNALLNVILYPTLLAAMLVFLGTNVFTDQLRWILFFGVTIASLETMYRMKEGFQGKGVDEIVYRGTWYAPIALPLVPLITMFGSSDTHGGVGLDGFRDMRFDAKLERERRYGEVYRLHEDGNGFLLELEFPRVVPPSQVKDEIGVPDEMPDYDYDITLQGSSLVVRGSVTDEDVRKVAAVSPAFPPDFSTTIQLPTPVTGFRHRFRGKTLEVALVRQLPG